MIYCIPQYHKIASLTLFVSWFMPIFCRVRIFKYLRLFHIHLGFILISIELKKLSLFLSMGCWLTWLIFIKYGNKIYLKTAQISIKSIKDLFLHNIWQLKFWNCSINYHLKKHVSSHRSLIMYCFFPQIGHKIYPSLCPHFLSKPNMSGKTSCISDTKIRNFGASN